MDSTKNKPSRPSIPDGYGTPAAPSTSNSQQLSWPVVRGDSSEPVGSQEQIKRSSGMAIEHTKLGDRGGM